MTSTPCMVDDDAFTSDDRSDRLEAAHACRSACPVLELCGRAALASREPNHVWGGVDLTPVPGQASSGLHELRERWSS